MSASDAGSRFTRVRAVLSLGMVLGLGTIGTLAAWSDSATATSGAFSTGTVALQVNDVENYSFTDLSLTEMLPGESKAATLTVQNKGSVPLNYTVRVTPSGGASIAAHIRVTVFGSAGASNSSTGGFRTGTCTGPQLGQATLSSGGTVDLVTTPQPLGGAAPSRNLCFVAAFATTAPQSVQNQSVPDVVFTFDGSTV